MPATTKHIPSVNFNVIDDKKFRIFNSPTWSKIGLEGVRDDLSKYCKFRKEPFAELSSSAIKARKLYNKRHNGFSNNCVSNAMGLLTYSDVKPDLFILKSFDLADPSNQIAVFSPLEIFNITTQTYSTKSDFHTKISHGDFKPLIDHDEKNYDQLNLVIMMNNKLDYHVIKIDVYNTDNGLDILLSDKIGEDDPIQEYTLEEFAENMDSFYGNPKLFGSPKSLVNRPVNGQFMPNSTLIVELKPVKKFRSKQDMNI